MLPLTERLKRPGLFTRAYGAKKLISTPIFTLYVLPRQEKTVRTDSLPKRVLPMMGFVVSKKVSKSAYRRNTVKRRIREAYRTLVGTDAIRLSIGKWYAGVLVIKEGALTATWTEMCGTLEKAFLEAARRYG